MLLPGMLHCQLSVCTRPFPPVMFPWLGKHGPRCVSCEHALLPADVHTWAALRLGKLSCRNCCAVTPSRCCLVPNSSVWGLSASAEASRQHSTRCNPRQTRGWYDERWFGKAAVLGCCCA
jgi:hypothetical protein